MRIIDASGLVLGRMASKVAKLALQGEEVRIVNCEKAVISGKKKQMLERWKTKVNWTDPHKGPFHQLMPDRFVRRVVRGMLPKKKWSEGSRGRQAFSRVMCYIGVPQELKGKETETLEGAQAVNLKTPYRITVGELTQLLRERNRGK